MKAGIMSLPWTTYLLLNQTATRVKADPKYASSMGPITPLPTRSTLIGLRRYFFTFLGSMAIDFITIQPAATPLQKRLIGFSPKTILRRFSGAPAEVDRLCLGLGLAVR